MNHKVQRILLCFIIIAFFLSIVPFVYAKTADEMVTVHVDNFSSLKEACYFGYDITIRLMKDITTTDTLQIFPSMSKKREVILDLNGYTLCFGERDDFYIRREEIECEIYVTLTSGKEGGTVIFQSNEESQYHRLVIVHGTMVLDENVLITMSNTDRLNSDLNRFVLVCRDASFVMNSGKIFGVGLYGVVVENEGQMVMNGGIIQGVGERIHGVENCKGEFYLNGGEIKVSGGNCISFFYNPRIMPGGPPPDFNNNAFVMTGGSLYAEGENAVSVAVARNCILIGGTIYASGEDSVGLLYNFTSDSSPKESPNITLLGGKITGESHALMDKQGYNAWYKNIAGEAVTVDASVKELAPGYKDVANGSWYAYDFYQLVYEGVFKGYLGGAFKPQGLVTRAEFITLLARFTNEDLSQYEAADPSFSDVKPSEWYTLPVTWGLENGIVNGYLNGSFGVSDNITREQLVTMLYRYTAYKEFPVDIEQKVSLQDFSDAENVSDWAVHSMQWAIDAGIIQGRGNNKIAPKEFATRAETAVLLMRLRKNNK